jgi:hypothetical protein
MKQRTGRLRTLVATVFAGLVVMAALSPTSGATTTSTAPTVFQTVNGEGAWSVFEQLVSWQNDLATAKSSIDLTYASRGSFFGREDLIDSINSAVTDGSAVDFAVSGIPFTPDELARVKGGNAAFIAAPVQVATLATLVNPPFGGWRTEVTKCNADLLDPNDPSTWPPGITDPQSQCDVTTPYTGPIRIATRNLAAMFLHYSGGESPPISAWNNPGELDAFGLHSTATEQQSIAMSFSPSASPGFAGRSDPDEINYYLQKFVQTAAPDVWEGIKKQPPIKPWEPITERLQQVAGVTRDGAEQQVDQLGLGCSVDGVCGRGDGGVAPAPPSMLRSFHSTYPAKTLDVAWMKNANGDWVAPTPDSINKAVDAGGDSPLYALTNKVAGAYPLVWVDNLYAPAHGLSVSKTESLATLIRYLATTGQAVEATNGEGRLSAPLVAQALAAANQLETSNCVGSDRKLVSSSDPGPLAPPTATAMRSIGNMLHCESVVVIPVTTTTVSSAPTTTATAFPAVGSEGGGNSVIPGVSSVFPGGSSSSPTNVVTPPDSSSSNAEVPTQAQKSGLLTAFKLPLPTPSGGGSSDRLATFLLGAFLYLLLRKPIARVARRFAS